MSHFRSPPVPPGSLPARGDGLQLDLCPEWQRTRLTGQPRWRVGWVRAGLVTVWSGRQFPMTGLDLFPQLPHTLRLTCQRPRHVKSPQQRQARE
jgi:hypothetical protein